MAFQLLNLLNPLTKGVIWPRTAAVAQLVEHVIRNDGVGGSSPFSGTTLLSKAYTRRMTPIAASFTFALIGSDRGETSVRQPMPVHWNIRDVCHPKMNAKANARLSKADG